MAIGGGTYAKVIPGGVGYGPGKPGTPELAHQANEAISVDDLLQLVRIYARALFALGYVGRSLIHSNGRGLAVARPRLFFSSHVVATEVEDAEKLPYPGGCYPTRSSFG